MRLRCFFALLSTICFHTATHAQRVLVWQPDTALRLVGSAQFDRVTIEDVRHDKSNIGSLRTGIRARHSSLVMEDSVSTSLARYATGLLRGSETTSGELLVVLRDFRADDYDGAEEVGTVHLRADLFRSAGATEYVHLRSFDTLCETKSRGDVTKNVQGLASQAILVMVVAAADAALIETTLHTHASALIREDEIKRKYPLYITPTPPRGIYYSLDDLLNLRPADTSFIDVKLSYPDAQPAWRFYRKNNRGKKGDVINSDEVLAIYDGKQWHISSINGFERLNEESSEFYTTAMLGGLVDSRSMWFTVNGIPVARVGVGDRGLQPTPYRVRLDPEAGRFVRVRRLR